MVFKHFLMGETARSQLLQLFYFLSANLFFSFAVETPSFLFGKGNVMAPKKKQDVKLESQEGDSTEAFLKKKGIECRKKARDAAQKCDTFFFTKKSVDFDEKWRAAAIQQRINEIASRMVRFSSLF